MADNIPARVIDGAEAIGHEVASDVHERLQALEAWAAQATALLNLHHTLALRYHHQEVIAMTPQAPVVEPETVPNALHIPS